MANPTFLKITNYLAEKANQHIDIKTSFRWNVNEVANRLRSGIELPVMLIDAVETQTQGTPTTPLIHNNTTAFTILGKPNTKTNAVDSYDAQNEVLDFCQGICFDIVNRILQDAELPRINNEKNWIYGLVNKSSFHLFKVGPVFSDGLYGYRCELTIKNKYCTTVDANKWQDL